MDNTKFPQGIRAYKPHEKAPSFVKANISIKREELQEWMDQHGSDIKLQLKEAKTGNFYLEIDTYQKPSGPND
jgi:hypothetical protein